MVGDNLVAGSKKLLVKSSVGIYYRQNMQGARLRSTKNIMDKMKCFSTLL